jgi:hypothetical protein
VPYSNGHILETQIQVTMNIMFHCGRIFMNLYTHCTRHWWEYQVCRLQLSGENFSVDFRCYNILNFMTSGRTCTAMTTNVLHKFLPDSHDNFRTDREVGSWWLLSELRKH